ncbi:hypothetical protein TMJG_00859, partial [Mycobacterium tuberculosis SUMu010]
MATRCTRLWGDCLAPPRPVLRAALSPGAGFAIATGLMVATRCTRLWGDCRGSSSARFAGRIVARRGVCDRHGADGGDPL